MIAQNRQKIFIRIMLLLVLVMLLPTRTASAASVTISFSVNQEIIHVGDEIEVTITLTSTDTMGDFEAFLSYNDSVLTPTSKPACITGEAGHLRISDIGASASVSERTYRIWFLATAPGDCDLAVYDRPKVYGYSDGIEMSVTSMNHTLSVLPAVDASNNSRLSVLRLVDTISEGVFLTPEFNPDTTVYFTAVPFEAEQLIISALAEDARSIVTISGEQNLSIGNNEVQITVTAENNTQTVYTIYVYRDENKSVTIAPEPTTDPEPTESALPVTGVTLSTGEDAVIVTEYHTYTVCERPEELVVPEGYAQTYLFLNEIQIAAYTEREGTNEFLLLTLKNESGEIGWYSYDRIEQTVQRVNQQQFIIQEVAQSPNTELQQTVTQYQQKQATLLFSLAFICGVCALLVLIIVWLLLCNRKIRRQRNQS